MLNQAIDRIAGFGQPSETAEVVAAALSDEEIREAAVMHLSGLLEAEVENVKGEEVRVGGLAVKLVASKDSDAVIRYDDVGLGFAVEGASIMRRDGPTSLAELLYLYHYARDRSDTLLYLPHSMRNERIAALVADSGASERFVRYILARYHTLCVRTAA